MATVFQPDASQNVNEAELMKGHSLIPLDFGKEFKTQEVIEDFQECMNKIPNMPSLEGQESM